MYRLVGKYQFASICEKFLQANFPWWQNDDLNPTERNFVDRKN